MSVTFVDELPNDEIKTKSRHNEIAAVLKDAPGKWAVVGTYKNRAAATSAAGTINKGRNAAYKDVGGRFEAQPRSTYVGTEDEKHTVYARFVPAPNGADQGDSTQGDSNEDSALKLPAFSG